MSTLTDRLKTLWRRGVHTVTTLLQRVRQVRPIVQRVGQPSAQPIVQMPEPAPVEQRAADLPEPAPEPESAPRPGDWLVTESPTKLEEAEQKTEARQRRAARRLALNHYERERMKLDKFVVPKGELPVKQPHAPRPPRAAAPAPAPEPPDEIPDENDKIILVDKIEGRDVAFRLQEFYGEMTFRDTILDQLDIYWVYLRRMKKHDPDAFDLYSRLGATIVPPATWFLHDGVVLEKDEGGSRTGANELSPWWRKHRPAFGCISYGLTKRIEAQEINPPVKTRRKKLWIPKFLYFNKYTEPPSTVQPTTGGDVYQVAVWWDRPQDESKHRLKAGTPDQFAIYISTDGSELRLLKLKTSWIERCYAKSRYRIDGKRGHTKKREHLVYKRSGWGYPIHHKEWAKHHHQPVEQFMVQLFIDAAESYERTNYSMTRIEVHKDDLTAVFSVDPKRTAYFFQDRDISLTKSGHKQPVFHWVKPHVRHTAKGDVTVPGHFRGLKEFDWAGYRVQISVPGLDHMHLTDWDVGHSDAEYFKPDDIVAGSPDIADWLNKVIDGGHHIGDPDMPRVQYHKHGKPRKKGLHNGTGRQH